MRRSLLVPILRVLLRKCEISSRRVLDSPGRTLTLVVNFILVVPCLFSWKVQDVIGKDFLGKIIPFKVCICVYLFVHSLTVGYW